MKAAPKYQLLPLARLSRELGAPYSLLYRLVIAGKIKPDHTAGRVLLFRDDRVADLLPALKAKLPAAHFLRIAHRVQRLASEGLNAL